MVKNLMFTLMSNRLHAKSGFHQSAQATVSDLHVPLLELLSKPLRGELQLETGQKGLEVLSREVFLETVRSKI